MSYIGKQPGFGIRNRYYYTATAAQTTFSGADDNGQTLAYADSKYLDVFLNGVLLVAGTDYTATTLTSVTLTSGASAADIIEIVAYDIFSVADTVSASNGGTFAGNVVFDGSATFNGSVVGIDTDKISEGNSSVEVVDTGTGYVAVTVDGTETARFASGGNVGLGGAPTTSYLEGIVGGETVTIGSASEASTTLVLKDDDGVFDLATVGGEFRIYDDTIERFRIDASGDLRFNSGYGSAATAYGCRAWVNFNGTGTVAIRASGNVSSITDNGTGDYTVNFTTAMPDTNYSYNLLHLGGDSVYIRELQPSTLQTNSFRVLAKYWGSSVTDAILNDGLFLNVQIFR